MDTVVKYFPKGGQHQEEVLRHAHSIVKDMDIKDVIVATTRGETGVLACQVFDTSVYNVVCVTHCDGFRQGIKQELKTSNREKILELGGKILTTVHALSGVETGISSRFPGGVVFPVELFAKLVREIIGDGVKVCIEIALMAADSGYVSDMEKDILCIGGTGTGADTACIIKPAYSRRFTELRVKRILAKPEVSRS